MAQDTRIPERSYLGSNDLDALARFNTELLSELWILRDRVRVLEHLLTQADVIAADAVDRFEPPEDLSAALLKERDELVARVAGAAHREELSVDEITKG